MSFDVVILAPIATLAVGLVTGFFAFQQWAIAREKLRFDLFEKRFRIFDAMRTFIRKVESGMLSDEAIKEFILGSSDVEFFFGGEVVAYRNELLRSAYKIRARHMARELHPEAGGRTAGLNVVFEEIEVFRKRVTQLSSTFAPYMEFRIMRAAVLDDFTFSGSRDKSRDDGRVI